MLNTVNLYRVLKSGSVCPAKLKIYFFPINPIVDKLGPLHVYRGFRNEFVDFCKKNASTLFETILN